MYSAISRLWRREASENVAPKEILPGAHKAGVPTFRESLPRLMLELRRARRYERPLAVLAVGVGSLRAVHGDHSGNGHSDQYLSTTVLATHSVFFCLGSLLIDSVRETDIVACSAEHHLYTVLLPETGEVEACLAVDRINRVIYDRAEVHLCTGLAEFPRDGLTVEDLFDYARKGWKGQVRVGHMPLVREASYA
jgi:hypothetical protein